MKRMLATSKLLASRNERGLSPSSLVHIRSATVAVTAILVDHRALASKTSPKKPYMSCLRRRGTTMARTMNQPPKRLTK